LHRLCFAGSDATVLGTTIGSCAIAVDPNTVGILREDGAGRNLTIPYGLGSGALAGALVGGRVEADEQDEVAAQDTTTGKRGKLFTGTTPRVGDPGPVGRGEVGVRGEVNKAKINDELDDLKTSDPLFPPDTDTTGGLEVVPVHDNMNEQVEGDRDPRHGGGSDELGVAQ